MNPLELYASAIDTSDYVARVAPVVHQLLHDRGELLDVGAGGGQLGRALANGRPWTAIDPSSSMRARLERLDPAPRIVAAGWQDAAVPPGAHDTVLAATMPAFFDHTEPFHARCREWARRFVVWIVPAHQGPRGLCFAGCLPRAWHGENETPGIEIVDRHLAPPSRPHDRAFADWTFSGVVKDLDALATYLADRLGWPATDARRSDLARHLASAAKPDPAGFRLEIPRRSAILVWRLR